MANLPPHLVQRLTTDEAAALHRAIDAIGEELAIVYATNVADHREARGDNSQLFGLKVWVHGRHRFTLRFEEDDLVRVVDASGSYSILTPPFSIGVYKLGDSPHDDVHACFPDASPTKRAYGQRNAAQLSIYDLSPTPPLPRDAAFGLNDLIVGHHGNPRDGLVKWYVGAYVIDAHGRPAWAWVQPQDMPGEATQPARRRPPIIPFDGREAEALEVRPRRDATGTAE
jgi:hypothetical protein